MFWKEWAIAKLTTSKIGENKHSYHEKIEKVVFVKILKANFHIFNEKIQVYRGCHSIRNPRIYQNNLNDIKKSIKKLARLNFDF